MTFSSSLQLVRWIGWAQRKVGEDWIRERELSHEQAFVLGRYRAKFARDAFDTIAVPDLDHLTLRAPRVAPPVSLAAFCSSERYDRAAHTFGKSYPDYVRAMLGDYDSAPDVVAYPRDEAEISAVMDWAGGVGASLTPFGGGSPSVHRRCPRRRRRCTPNRSSRHRFYSLPD
jgi:hypothetical protein